ncbi:MAG: hypothetical protein GY854_24225 [Deltaproteobacteria bacterium]|nr:hypothetical protein [Deltaproteobacteria bacterium]
MREYTLYALREKIVGPEEFERLVTEILYRRGYTSISPRGGSRDKGVDAVIPDDSEVGERGTVFAYSQQRDWQAKLEHDADKASSRVPKPGSFVFCTTQSATGEIDRRRDKLRERHGFTVEVIDGRQLALWLDNEPWGAALKAKYGLLSTEDSSSSRAWQVPYHRNLDFIGRETELEILREALHGGVPENRTVAIHGMGGIGKTQLGLEYVYRHSADYEVVWWIDGSSALAANEGLAELAIALRLRDLPYAVRQRALLARRWLDDHSNWLLIADNVDAPADIARIVPPSRGGGMLLTSRHPHWRGQFREIPLEAFSPDDSVSYLLTASGSQERKAAREVAAALGYLPLALAHAAAYIQQTGTTLAQYLELLVIDRPRLFSAQGSIPNYDLSVAKALTLNFESLAEIPEALLFLQVIAFLGPDGIPLSMFSGQSFLPEPLRSATTDKLVMNQVVARLLDYSIVSRHENTISLHRLVQAVTRDGLPVDKKVRTARTALRLLLDAFPGDSDRSERRDTCASLLPHLLAAARHCTDLETAPKKISLLLNRAGRYLDVIGEYERAAGLNRRALELGDLRYDQ